MSKKQDQDHDIEIKRFNSHLEGKKGQILLGAFKSIVEIGIASTTIRSIATYANVNSGIIHYYFGNKNEIISQVLEMCYYNAILNVETIFGSNLSPKDKINKLFDLGISLSRDRQEEWIVLTSIWAHSLSGNTELQLQHQKLNRRFQAAMLKILKNTSIKWDVGDGKDIAMLMVGAMHGIAFQQTLNPKKFNPEKPINLLRKLILQAF